MKYSPRQSGFSLIELLIAFIIFSVGLLAVAGLQTVSKSASFEGIQRTTASHIAHGLLEDIRANGTGVGVYLASAGIGDSQIAAEPVPSCTGLASECNALEKATHDLWFWEQSLDGNRAVGADGSAGGLVSPTMCITGPVAGGAGVYAVTIVWRGITAMNGADPGLCGAAGGKYGAANEFRRSVVVSTFIDPSI